VVVEPALPVSARLAWWTTAWLRGQVVVDLVLDAVLLDDATHVVAGLPGVDGSVSLARALAEIRISGVVAPGLALPAPGDPVGIGGPAAFSTAALDAGEAVVAGEIGGLNPERPAGPGLPLVVLYSDDLDATLASVRGAGATIDDAPFEFPGGRRFHFTDPAGNSLAVWTEA
jgi:hypothetical protein